MRTRYVFSRLRRAYWPTGPNRNEVTGYLCELLVIRYGSQSCPRRSRLKEGISIAIDKRGLPMVAPWYLRPGGPAEEHQPSTWYIRSFITARKAYLSNPSESSSSQCQVPLPRPSSGTCESAWKPSSDRNIQKPDINEDNLHSQMWKTHMRFRKSWMPSHSMCWNSP